VAGGEGRHHEPAANSAVERKAFTWYGVLRPVCVCVGGGAATRCCRGTEAAGVGRGGRVATRGEGGEEEADSWGSSSLVIHVGRSGRHHRIFQSRPVKPISTAPHRSSKGKDSVMRLMLIVGAPEGGSGSRGGRVTGRTGHSDSFGAHINILRLPPVKFHSKGSSTGCFPAALPRHPHQPHKQTCVDHNAPPIVHCAPSCC
jgi:hypothetical protein